MVVHVDRVQVERVHVERVESTSLPAVGSHAQVQVERAQAAPSPSPALVHVERVHVERVSSMSPVAGSMRSLGAASGFSGAGGLVSMTAPLAFTSGAPTMPLRAVCT